MHSASPAARLKDGPGVYDNLRKILGRNMVWRSLMTSHNPNLSIYNWDAANTIPAVLAEALLYARPGILQLPPALPDRLPDGTVTGIRGRDHVLIQSLSWDIAAHTATARASSVGQPTAEPTRSGS